MFHPKWKFREAHEADRDFLFDLYKLTMRQVVAETWGWDEAWQENDFHRRFQSYVARIIQLNTSSIGAVFLQCLPQSLYIHEIQLLPLYQGKGIGSEVIRALLLEASTHNLSVSLSVVNVNHRAQELYKRLGFRIISVEAPFIRMENKGLTARVAQQAPNTTANK